MKTMKWTLLLAFFAIWACQEDQLSQEEVWKDSSSPSPRVERLRTIKRVDNAPATRAVSVKDKLWQPGDTIRIKFQNADEYPGMSDKVIQYAAIWLKYANLHFKYVDKENDADVKIGFDMDDRRLSWSTIGTDCKQIPQDEVSINFVELEFCSEEEIQGEVLRNFGHVLGLGFEHRSPASPITLNEVQTRKYFRKKLSAEDITNDILPYYNSDQTNYTEFDPLSIMVLKLPSITRTDTNSNIDLKYNYTLSSKDISFVRDSLYPTPPRMDCLMEITVKIFENQGRTALFCPTIQDSIVIDFGDEVIETYYPFPHPSESCFHDYAAKGIYTIKIFGTDTAITEFMARYDSANPHTICNLKIHQNRALKKIWCFNHKLPSLDFSECPLLEDLNLDNDSIHSINLSQNKKLSMLILNNNNISTIDISQSRKLKSFLCDNNNLTSINLTNQSALQSFSCNSNRLNSIDFHGNPNLLSINVSNNRLTKLDVTHNKQLVSLSADLNQISEVRCSQNPELVILLVDSNRIRSLDVSSLTGLRRLECQKNPLDSIELIRIANDIRDCRLEGPNSWGSVTYSHEVPEANRIFEEKRWYTTIPTSYSNTLDQSVEIVKSALSRKLDPIVFNRLYGDSWK